MDTREYQIEKYKRFWKNLSKTNCNFPIDEESKFLVESIGVPEHHQTFEFSVTSSDIFSKHYQNRFLHIGKSYTSLLCFDSIESRVVRIPIHKLVDTIGSTISYNYSQPAYICQSIFTYFILITIIEEAESIIYKPNGRMDYELNVTETEASEILAVAKDLAKKIDPTINQTWENIWIRRLT